MNNRPQSGQSDRTPALRALPTREVFADLLRRATRELALKTGKQEVMAASLGNHIRALLHIQLGDAEVNLDGRFFGPILYPHISPDAHDSLKFRQFLAAFPEIVV